MIAHRHRTFRHPSCASCPAMVRLGRAWKAPPCKMAWPWLQKPPAPTLAIGPGFARELTLRARLNAYALPRPLMTICCYSQPNHPFYPRTLSSHVDLVCFKAVGLPLMAYFIPSPDLNANYHDIISFRDILALYYPEAIHLHDDGILPYCLQRVLAPSNRCACSLGQLNWKRWLTLDRHTHYRHLEISERCCISVLMGCL